MTITLHLHTAGGRTTELAAEPGQSLMQAAVGAGVAGIAADCGGVLSCATCHVIVDEAWAARLPPPAPDEAAMLAMTATPCEANSRLACQILLQPALDGLRVRIPDTQY